MHSKLLHPSDQDLRCPKRPRFAPLKRQLSNRFWKHLTANTSCLVPDLYIKIKYKMQRELRDYFTATTDLSPLNKKINFTTSSPRLFCHRKAHFGLIQCWSILFIEHDYNYMLYYIYLIKYFRLAFHSINTRAASSFSACSLKGQHPLFDLLVGGRNWWMAGTPHSLRHCKWLFTSRQWGFSSSLSWSGIEHEATRVGGWIDGLPPSGSCMASNQGQDADVLTLVCGRAGWGILQLLLTPWMTKCYWKG